MKEIQLTFTLDETNIILEALGEQPFVKVHQIIQKIQNQASAQLNTSTEDNQLNPPAGQ